MQSLKGLIFVLIFNFSLASFSNESEVKAEVDAYEYLIGDHINLNLTASHPKDWKVVFPALADTLGKFEIVSLSKFDTLITEESNKIKISQNVKLIQFDSGSYKIPPLNFVFDPGKDELGQFIPKKTNAIDILVNTVQIDTTQSYKDIKANLEPEFSIWEYKKEIYLALGALAFIVIMYFVWRKFIKGRKKEEVPEEDYDPTIEPHVLALGSLKKLEEKKLWQEGKIKAYHTEITDILRVYIKRCFAIDALEMTSDEIIDSFAYKNIEPELIDSLRTIFTTADFVKFAKSKPLPDENENSLKLAFKFVNATISYSFASMKPELDENMENSKEAKNV